MVIHVIEIKKQVDILIPKNYVGIANIIPFIFIIYSVMIQYVFNRNKRKHTLIDTYTSIYHS